MTEQRMAQRRLVRERHDLGRRLDALESTADVSRPVARPTTASFPSPLSATVQHTVDRRASRLAAAPAAVSVSGVSKTFRLPQQRYSTLKERALHPFTANRYDELAALRDVTFEVKQGEFFGVVGRNGSGKSTLLKCVAGIFSLDDGDDRDRRTAVAVHRAGGGLQPRPDRSRQRDHQRDHARPDAAGGAGALRLDHRVRRARGVRRPEAEELLVRHERAARLLRGDPGRRGRAAGGRGPGRGRRVVPAQVLRGVRPHEGARAGRSSSSRTTWAASSASATAGSCWNAARSSTSASPRRSRAPTPSSTSGTRRATNGRPRPFASGPRGARPRTGERIVTATQGEPVVACFEVEVIEALRDPAFGVIFRNDARHTIFVPTTEVLDGRDRRVHGRRAPHRPLRLREPARAEPLHAHARASARAAGASAPMTPSAAATTSRRWP